MEVETDNSINFLDITIQKENNTLTFNVYRKLTTIDSIIPRDSCHPQEHKHVAIGHLINRMNTYNLNLENKEGGKNIIKHIISKEQI
jgi:RNA binding exosome subunit